LCCTNYRFADPFGAQLDYIPFFQYQRADLIGRLSVWIEILCPFIFFGSFFLFAGWIFGWLAGLIGFIVALAGFVSFWQRVPLAMFIVACISVIELCVIVLGLAAFPVFMFVCYNGESQGSIAFCYISNISFVVFALIYLGFFVPFVLLAAFAWYKTNFSFQWTPLPAEEDGGGQVSSHSGAPAAAYGGAVGGSSAAAGGSSMAYGAGGYGARSQGGNPAGYTSFDDNSTSQF
jgi:hypothetical protein